MVLSALHNQAEANGFAYEMPSVACAKTTEILDLGGRGPRPFPGRPQ